MPALTIQKHEYEVSENQTLKISIFSKSAVYLIVSSKHMTPQKLLLTFTLFLSLIKTNGQTAKAYFTLVDSVVLTEVTSKSLQIKLDTLKSKFIPSRSSFSLSFDRDIDFGFRHNRLSIQLNFERFQIDLLARNDTIFARTIRHYYNPFDMDKTTLAFDSSFSFEKVNEYLNQRNKFYKSQKTPKDLIKEISDYRVFAFYCGDGSPLTDEGKQIKEFVAEEKTDDLLQMLQSICVETQAYGVSGFRMLENNGYPIASDISKIIKRIKKRNSETVICSGCITGIIEKIYSKR